MGDTVKIALEHLFADIGVLSSHLEPPESRSMEWIFDRRARGSLEQWETTPWV
jgi:hypothetical protein